LVQILRPDVMQAEGIMDLSPPTITAVADGLGVPRSQVEGVAGFYAFFATEPRGRYRVLFSDNITDEMQGSGELRQRMLDAFHLELGEVSRDGQVSVDLTACTGLCDQGPAMLVNGRPIARLTPARIGAICALIRGGSPVDQWPDNLFTIDTHIERRDRLLDAGDRAGRGDGCGHRARRGRGVIAELRTSELRGRGGAGFSDGTEVGRPAPRLRAPSATSSATPTRASRARSRTACSSRPTRALIEGMTVAAFAVGARKGFIYLRGEYPFLEPGIEAALSRGGPRGSSGATSAACAASTSTSNCTTAPGAYVCGEESALIESLEGGGASPATGRPTPSRTATSVGRRS
jgi:[NiFe] hydrogenase diaphorase moiety large subunit